VTDYTILPQRTCYNGSGRSSFLEHVGHCEVGILGDRFIWHVPFARACLPRFSIVAQLFRIDCNKTNQEAALCGIAGIVYHNSASYPNLGRDLLSLIEPLESRGPDSCGVALYGDAETKEPGIYKEVGAVKKLAKKYELYSVSGSHGIGHTRMATESVVDTNHCHPFTAGELAIVHNGQISNYYKLRFQLEQAGRAFETHNDSEAIAHYIHHQLSQGKPLKTALEKLLRDIDGTYTFLVATPDKVALVRDKYAAKPAVIYETAEMVAIASEYRALLTLPHFDPSVPLREPDAGEINVWSVVTVGQLLGARG
jgi:glucosamine 6-phosphate synthetase-like amidotransferase/phosphosugar isomerase protein